MYRLLNFLFLLITVMFAVNGYSNQSDKFFNGSKKITLIENNGTDIFIGTIHFSQKKQIISYKIHLEHQLFTDYFLSMKEMKCLEGRELWCHIAYPYENPRTLVKGDFRWLAHDLLFMYKKKSDFGANFDNGIYYQFSIVNNALIGTAMAVDLNILAAPPDDMTSPPIGEYDIEEVELSTRWLPKIKIK
jgi:hypothetical protein